MMKAQTKKILLLEETVSSIEYYKAFFKPSEYTVKGCDDNKAIIEVASSFQPDVIVLGYSDIKIQKKILRKLVNSWPDTPVIVMTEHGSIQIAIDIMRYGAFDFLLKPFSEKRFLSSIKEALLNFDRKEVVSKRKSSVKESFIGSSLVMKELYRKIDKVAKSHANVFITGDSGTGKELCAESIHKGSPRKNRAFVAINCAAIPAELMESEIFGHVKGAFTGAISNRDGSATLANHGTLFLDEIGEMSLSLQAKLLRFLQTGVYQKVGGSKELKSDIRVLCATNRNPLEEVKEGRLREDLYYRLHVLPIHMPPLEDRDRDVLEIADMLLEKYSEEEGRVFSSFSSRAQETILNYDWPGNVRELQNLIRHIVVMAEDKPVITQKVLSEFLYVSNKPRISKEILKIFDEKESIRSEDIEIYPWDTKTPFYTKEMAPLWKIEKETIENVINECDGNILKAAAILEISPSTIYRKKSSWEDVIEYEVV